MNDFNMKLLNTIGKEIGYCLKRAQTEEDPKEISYWKENAESLTRNLQKEIIPALEEWVKESKEELPKIIGMLQAKAEQKDTEGFCASMLLRHLKENCPEVFTNEP